LFVCLREKNSTHENGFFSFSLSRNGQKQFVYPPAESLRDCIGESAIIPSRMLRFIRRALKLKDNPKNGSQTFFLWRTL